MNRPKNCLFVQWSQSTCRYVLVVRSIPTPRVLAGESFEIVDSASRPEQLRTHLESRKIRCRQVVLLLSRIDLDISSHHLPPAADDELPDLVRSAVTAEFEDGSQPHIRDYLVTQQDDTGCETLVFSLDEQYIRELQSSFKMAGLKLAGLSFGGLGGLELLHYVTRRPPSTAVVMALGDDEVDLAVTDYHDPLVFRSIPCPSEELPNRTDQLAAEIRRTLNLAHRVEDTTTALYIFGDVVEHRQLAQSLSDHLSGSASVINPLDRIRSSAEFDSIAPYANLIGLACAWNGPGLRIDLLNPRRPPAPPSRLPRIAVWTGVVTALVLGFGFVAWQDRAHQLEEIAQRQQKLERLADRANKALERKDVFDTVRAWRSDDIAWLDELHDLSEQLPQREHALIRRMHMSTNPQGNGIIDLAVQVSQPDVVARLEDAVRDERHSVSSQRVAESDDQADLPWAFDTRISFTPAKLPELSAESREKGPDPFRGLEQSARLGRTSTDTDQQSTQQ